MNSFLRCPAVSLAILVFLVGCGKGKRPWDTVYPATGVAIYDGKPLANAQILLIPEDGEVPATVRPSATTDEEGNFEFGTYAKSDGAPAGNYKIVALRYPIVGKAESPSAGPNNLPSKYARPETTDLKLEVSPQGLEPSEISLKK